MTRKTTRMLAAFMSCSMAVSNLIPFNVLAETIPEKQETKMPQTNEQIPEVKEAAPVALSNFTGSNVHAADGKIAMGNTGSENHPQSLSYPHSLQNYHYQIGRAHV